MVLVYIPNGQDTNVPIVKSVELKVTIVETVVQKWTRSDSVEYKEGRYCIVQDDETLDIEIFKYTQVVMRIKYNEKAMSRRRLKMWLRNYVDIIEQR